MEDRIKSLETGQDKIERAVEKIADAVITLAALEERMCSYRQRMDRADDHMKLMLEKVEKNQDRIQEITLQTVPQSNFISKAFWVGITVFGTVLATVVATVLATWFTK